MLPGHLFLIDTPKTPVFGFFRSAGSRSCFAYGFAMFAARQVSLIRILHHLFG
jgi:hypothetical protein